MPTLVVEIGTALLFTVLLYCFTLCGAVVRFIFAFRAFPWGEDVRSHVRAHLAHLASNDKEKAYITAACSATEFGLLGTDAH